MRFLPVKPFPHNILIHFGIKYSPRDPKDWTIFSLFKEIFYNSIHCRSLWNEIGNEPSTSPNSISDRRC